jgi:hypothetical protein
LPGDDELEADMFFKCAVLLPAALAHESELSNIVPKGSPDDFRMKPSFELVAGLAQVCPAVLRLAGVVLIPSRAAEPKADPAEPGPSPKGQLQRGGGHGGAVYPSGVIRRVRRVERQDVVL